jgi:hypothetical protein
MRKGTRIRQFVAPTNRMMLILELTIVVLFVIDLIVLVAGLAK